MITIYDRTGRPLMVHEIDAQEHLSGGFFSREPRELRQARLAAPLQEPSETATEKNGSKRQARRSRKTREADS